MNRKISVNNCIFVLFNIMVFLLIIPYIFCGKMIFDNPIFFYNYLNASTIKLNLITRILIYVKDFICLLLFALLIFRKKNILAFLAVIFGIGIIILLINNNFTIKMLLAGYRAISFAIVSQAFFEIYNDNYFKSKQFKILIKLLNISFCIELIAVIVQIVCSNSLTTFGSGGYRFSGFFNGSGNLGCYCVAFSLLLAVLNTKGYTGLTNIKYFTMLLLSIFLTVASGTRTCMVLCIIIFAYESFRFLGKKMKLKKDIVITAAIFATAVFGKKILNTIINWTNRGDLSISGGGRLSLLINQFTKSNGFQLLFGHGIGVGTNASVSMGLNNTQVSDSTINLIFTQFGALGLITFLILLYKLIIRISKKSNYRNVYVLFTITILVMLFVGNLFEHNAMVVLLILTYAIINNDSITSSQNEVKNEKN